MEQTKEVLPLSRREKPHLFRALLQRQLPDGVSNQENFKGLQLSPLVYS